MKKSILLVDDHAIMRNGLRLLLEELSPLLLFHEAADTTGALDVLKHYPVDVIVLDIHLGDTDSISLVELLSIRYPHVYILVFSMLPEKVYGHRMLQAGARSYLPKSSTLLEIRRAFGLVLARQTYMSQERIESLSGSIEMPALVSPFKRLSRREFEIVLLMLSGSSVNDIALKLNVKPSTVGTYKARVLEKLKIKTLFELKDLALLYNVSNQALKTQQSA